MLQLLYSVFVDQCDYIVNKCVFVWSEVGSGFEGLGNTPSLKLEVLSNRQG